MQRVTITIDDNLAEEVDGLAKVRGYQNRSEIVRDLVRAGIAQTSLTNERTGDCIGTVLYVYDRNTRDLPNKLANAYHHHHDLSVATMRIALNHESCLEVAVLRGSASSVQTFATHLVAERGVRHGRVVLIPAEIEDENHAHGGSHAHKHQHIRVR
jgi:CopG family nickel-responsive transcriptional regulator